MSGPIASVDTGEVIASITPDEARHLTDRIRDTVEATWALLLEAHEQRAWAALGYSTWAEYVSAEFSMSRRHSYRLLDHGRVVRAIEEATNSVTRGSHGSVSPIGDISERVARDIKPHLDEVTAEIEERVASEPRPDSGRRKGPAFVKLGARVRYRESDVEAWLAERTVATSDMPATSRRTSRLRSVR